MAMSKVCPECGAALNEESTCQEIFGQLLVWEHENPEERYPVHNLLVLCYHLQHPSLYSPDGLRYAQKLLVEFVENDASPQEVRRRDRGRVDSGRRNWKITARDGSVGAYPNPIHWTLTSADVIARGPDRYADSVREWARSVLVDLRASNNFFEG